MKTDRRRFLQLLGAGTVAASFPATIKRALAVPAHHRKGTIDDVEHIVFLMQENRAFDHYFGTLRGVRGFGDPRAVKLPSGDPVWFQAGDGGRVGPFHPQAPELGLQFLEDLPHGWSDTQKAWNGGKYDQWIPNKGSTAMSYLTRDDIPFHYALADAFTVCDAYYCSFFGPTDPNRYHMWSGWVGNDGQGGGPVLANDELGYSWTTYPERLQNAGVTWKIYQDAGLGLDAEHYWGWTDDAFIGNYGDNAILYFTQYQNAQPGSPLYEGARRGTNILTGGTLFDDLLKDVREGTLPQVSWIVAPEAYTEHGNWPSNYGAWYVSQVLDALTSNPELFSKTVLFLMFDENDGFFDHMVPPTPPQHRAQGLSTVDTVNEVYPGSARFQAGPYGMGVRVPMLVISPWSKGGWVASEVFDHTSLIRFVEQRFARHYPGLIESNITPWRRAVAGDLTSTFDFKSPNKTPVRLPDTSAYLPADHDRHDDYVPTPPTTLSVPAQEPGVRPARPVPYELQASGEADLSDGTVRIHFANTGTAAAVLQVRAGASADGPWTYTVGAGEHLAETWSFAADGETSYDLSVYGPNGFFRALKGSLAGDAANLAVKTRYHREGCGIELEIRNRARAHAKVRISSAYDREVSTHFLSAGDAVTRHFSLGETWGWYDFVVEVESDPTFRQQVAGHVETGDDSVTDPALGRR